MSLVLCVSDVMALMMAMMRDDLPGDADAGDDAADAYVMRAFKRMLMSHTRW